MVNLDLVLQSDANLRSTTLDQISLLAGATSDLGLAMLTEYTKQSTRPKIYIVERDPGKFQASLGTERKLIQKAPTHHVGLLSIQQYNEDGREETISLRFYVRARTIQHLLPLLSSPPSSRIVSIHGAGKEGRLNEEDLELKHTFSMQNAAMHTSTMNTLALREIASTYSSISCVHVFPGLAVTPGFHTFSED
ncbi:hypothetical protein ACLMJK_001089 [Lecanora helva]